VSREHTPLVMPQDRLSSNSAELLTALLQHPTMAASLKERLKSIPKPEMAVIMDRLLDHAHREQEWGTPPILDACIAVADADPSQGPRLAAFLSERPIAQITPSIVPRLSSAAWGSGVFEKWKRIRAWPARSRKRLPLR